LKDDASMKEGISLGHYHFYRRWD